MLKHYVKIFIIQQHFIWDKFYTGVRPVYKQSDQNQIFDPLRQILMSLHFVQRLSEFRSVIKIWF